MSRAVRIGIRVGKLAQAQAKSVVPKLAGFDLAPEVVSFKSGTDGRELQQALLRGDIDLSLDVLKDVPARGVDGLAVAAYLKRGDSRDAVLTRDVAWADLPAGASIGAGSIRRVSQLRAVRPDLNYRPILGDSEARIAKLRASEFDAIVLGVDGLRRLAVRLKDLKHEILDFDVLMPAPGQAVLVLEAQTSDRWLFEAVAPLNDPTTEYEARAERAFLATFGGGCGLPAAAHATLGDLLTIRGLVASASGAEVLRDEVSGHPNAPEYLGARLADVLMYRGARRLLIPERHEPVDDGS